jgi:hypothetical protein
MMSRQRTKKGSYHDSILVDAIRPDRCARKARDAATIRSSCIRSARVSAMARLSQLLSYQAARPGIFMATLGDDNSLIRPSNAGSVNDGTPADFGQGSPCLPRDRLQPPLPVKASIRIRPNRHDRRHRTSSAVSERSACSRSRAVLQFIRSKRMSGSPVLILSLACSRPRSDVRRGQHVHMKVEIVDGGS